MNQNLSWFVPPHVLTIIILVPFLFALWMAFLCPSGDKKKMHGPASLGVFLTLFISVTLWFGFDSSIERFSIHSQFNDVWSFFDDAIVINLGINGASMYAIIFTTIIAVLSIVSAWDAVTASPRRNLTVFFMSEAAALAVLSSTDILHRGDTLPLTLGFSILAAGMFFITRSAA